MKITFALRPMMSGMGSNNCPYEMIPGITQKRDVQSFMNNDIMNNKISKTIQRDANTNKNQRQIIE
jgi:hypothetical protein